MTDSGVGRVLKFAPFVQEPIVLTGNGEAIGADESAGDAVGSVLEVTAEVAPPEIIEVTSEVIEITPEITLEAQG